MPAIKFSPSPTVTWQKRFAAAIRDIDELCDVLALPADFRESARQAVGSFPLIVPREFVARMKPGDPNDPLLRQVLPTFQELDTLDGFVADPVGDQKSRRAPGLIHKYQSRALLMVTGRCAVHCRYCFRRHYPYDDEPRSLDEWEEAFDVLAQDTSIDEIIFSGGDPLSLTDESLRRLIDRLSAIGHLKRLRIHSRWPIVIPSRITDEFIGMLVESRLTPFMVVHANHPAELDEECRHALRRLIKAGITTLNQAVLLRGINDSADVLVELCRSLVNLGVLPYYLNVLDRVAGAAHFETAEQLGKELIELLRQQLPGYAVPRLVREIEGMPSKTPLSS